MDLTLLPLVLIGRRSQMVKYPMSTDITGGVEC